MHTIFGEKCKIKERWEKLDNGSEKYVGETKTKAIAHSLSFIQAFFQTFLV
jgi:hypothetical protein